MIQAIGRKSKHLIASDVRGKPSHRESAVRRLRVAFPKNEFKLQHKKDQKKKVNLY
jgi:hypothetical protein